MLERLGAPEGGHEVQPQLHPHLHLPRHTAAAATTTQASATAAMDVRLREEHLGLAEGHPRCIQFLHLCVWMCVRA